LRFYHSKKKDKAAKGKKASGDQAPEASTASTAPQDLVGTKFTGGEGATQIDFIVFAFLHPSLDRALLVP
jgi:hypothetical protein